MAGAMLVSLKKAYVAKMRHFELPSDLVDLERGVVLRTPDEWWGEASKAYYVVKKACFIYSRAGGAHTRKYKKPTSSGLQQKQSKNQ